MSSAALLRARVSELETENVYLQQTVEQLRVQLEEAQARAAQQRPSSSSPLAAITAPSSADSAASPIQSPTSSPLPSLPSMLSLPAQLHAQSLQLQSLQSALAELRTENEVLRGKQASKTLLMSFTLMDSIKEEKEALRAEVEQLRMQLFVKDEQRSSGQQRQRTAEEASRAQQPQPSDSAEIEQQKTSQTLSPSKDGKAGVKVEEGEEKQESRAGEDEPLPDRGKTGKKKGKGEGAAEGEPEEQKMDTGGSLDESKLTRHISGSGDEEKVEDADSKAKERPKRRTIKADKDRRNADASAVFSPSPSPISSAPPPSIEPLPTSSSSPSPSSASKLRITSNRLPFMEDSPLYRQQLDIMRVRVAALFSRLDHLAEKASEYSRAASMFAKAGEVFAEELSRSWEDVEVNDGGEELQQMEEAMKKEAAKKDKQKRRLERQGTKKGAAGRTRKQRESAEGISSASIAEAVHLDSAFLNIGLARKASPSTSSNDPSTSTSAGSTATGPLSSPTTTNKSDTGSTLSAPTRLKNSASAASIKAFLTDIHTKVADALTDATGTGTAAPTFPPAAINTSSIHSSSPGPSVPASAPAIPTTKRLTPFNRSTSITPTSSFPSSSSSAHSASAHASSASSSFSSTSEVHEADRLLLELEARQKAERASHPRVEQAVTLSNAMSKMSSIVSTMSSVTSNLSMFLEHLLVTAVTSVGERYRVACKKTMVSMESVIAEYELALSARLAQRKQEREKLFSVLNIFGQKKVLDEEFMRICALRREMEIRRFDHIQLLNEICTSKRMELIEVCCASFLSFVTFFHEGWFASNYIKDEVDVIQESITRRKGYYHKLAKSTLQQRQRIAKSALPINLPVIFPLSPWHELSCNGKAARMSGYLRQPLDDDVTRANKVKEWKRRWFVLDDGSFYYLNDAEYYQPKHVVNVLTCAARPWMKSAMDFVFELISPTKTFVFQAESEYEMKAWVAVFANSTEQLLGQQQTRSDTHALDSKLNVSALEQQKRVKAGLLSQLRRDNAVCADCGLQSPDWASINLGVMICIVCSGIHRSLGVHVSKVRSMTLDDWETDLLDMMVSIGNERSNSVFEGSIHEEHGRGGGGSSAAGTSSAAGRKPLPTSSREEKEEFIQAKYVRRSFLSKSVLHLCGDLQDMGVRMWKAIEADEVVQCILLHALGCGVGWTNDAEHGRSLLHHAAEYDSSTCLEWLLQNNADPDATDREGNTPLMLARFNQSKAVMARLEGTGGGGGGAGGGSGPSSGGGSGTSSASSSGSSTPVHRSSISSKPAPAKPK